MPRSLPGFPVDAHHDVLRVSEKGLRNWLGAKIVAVVGLALVCLLAGGCGPAAGFDARLSSAVKPYRFSVAAWEFSALTESLTKSVGPREEKVEGGEDEVAEYFSLVTRIDALKSQIRAKSNGTASGDSASRALQLRELQERQATLAGTVERTLKKQVRETLTGQGIFHPLDRFIKLKGSFPPLSFTLERPPYLLVISPRERIETIRTVLLRQDIGVPEMGNIEAEVDALGVSSLVVELGGLGLTYPTLVTNVGNLRFVLDTAAHEWLHQYLAFQPLGFRYLLDLSGVSRNYEIAMMNETVADIVGREISAEAIEKYYPDHGKGYSQKEAGELEFDFDREMREIRKTVDRYLVRGEIEAAETFMEQRRQFLETKGYYLRKLNQAYFAFHGKYADRPAFISPIGLELKELRVRSDSLKEFLDKMAVMTGRHDLKIALGETP